LRRSWLCEAGEGLEVEDGADGRAPSVSGREGERGAQVGRCGFVGRKGMWAARGKKEKERREKGRWAAGLGWAGGEFEFVFFFKSISNQFQTLLNSNLLHKFSQLYFTIIFKNFHKYFKTF
jgi:hypothetical protein